MLNRIVQTAFAALLVGVLCLPALAAEKGPELSGKAWLESSQNEKLAFLYGASHVVAIEEVLAEKDNRTPSLFVTAWVKAFGDANWVDIAKKLDAWYAAHPDQASRSVFDVLWYEFMAPAVL